MEARIPGFKGEYLWEFSIPRLQLSALADAVPEDLYAWRPAEDTRTFSAVLVHIAAGNIALLRVAGRHLPDGPDPYGSLEGDELARFAAIVRRNIELERTLVVKQDVIDFLKRSFDAVEESFTASSEEDLNTPGQFFGEMTTVRRVYMRMLAHTHEHMGQAIAYARSAGVKIPWPDPLREMHEMIERARSGKASTAVSGG